MSANLPEGGMSGAQPAPGLQIWRFDPEAWSRIQDAVGQPATGDPNAVWDLINQALLFTSMEQQRQSLPTVDEIRADKQRFLATLDSLISQIGLSTLPAPGPLQLEGQMFSWLMQGAMRRLHPTGPPLGENRRRDRLPVYQSVDRLTGHYDEVQIAAQKQVLTLLRQLKKSLGLLRELAAESVAETSRAQSRGVGLDLTRLTFVNFTALAYEAAYERPASPGHKDAAYEAGPAVRFIAGIAREARKADTIEPHYKALLNLGLQMIPNTIHRLLVKRQAR